GVAAAGFYDQFAAFAVEAVGFALQGLGAGGDLGDLDAALGDVAGAFEVARAGLGGGVYGVAGLQALVGGQAAQFGIGLQLDEVGAQGGQGGVAVLGVGRDGDGERQDGGGQEGADGVHRRSPSCSWLRRRWTSARRWATWAVARASRLRARARSASAAAARA